MHISSLFIAVSLASVAIALPQPKSNVEGFESESSKLVSRAPADDKVYLTSRAESKCFISKGCSFLSGGSSVSGGAAFTLSGSTSSSFFFGGILQWGGLSSFGYKGVSEWNNNFKGASQDFGVFVNGFAGLTTTFQSSEVSWFGAQQAIAKFGSDFSIFVGQFSSFKGFGSVEGGKELFKSYFIECFKTFQSFFQVILTRYGASTFQKIEIFGQFESGFKILFKFSSTIGLESLSILQSASIDFGLFKQCGFAIQSWISSGTSISGSSSSGNTNVVGSGSSGGVVTDGSKKCFLPEGCPFLSGGSISGGAAFTTSISFSSFFSSSGSLQWGGLSQFGYKGLSGWNNNFEGASHDFGIFVNGFSGLTTTFKSFQVSWSGAQQAIVKFASDFSTFCNQFSSFRSFGSVEGGKQIFQTYFIHCFKTFQSFFEVILNRYGQSTFQKTEIFGQFPAGFKSLFKFASTVGLGSYSLLQSAKIDFTLFRKCGFTLESWIGGGISARNLAVEML